MGVARCWLPPTSSNASVTDNCGQFYHSWGGWRQGRERNRSRSEAGSRAQALAVEGRVESATVRGRRQGRARGRSWASGSPSGPGRGAEHTRTGAPSSRGEIAGPLDDRFRWLVEQLVDAELALEHDLAPA